MFNVPYQCPVTNRFFDAGRVVKRLGDESEPTLDAIRDVCNLPEIHPDTGEGFTDDAVMASWDTFAEWLEGKESGVVTGPDSVQPTESLPASAPKSCCH